MGDMKPEGIASWAQIVMYGDPAAKEPPGVIEATTALHRTLRRRADQHVPEAEETAQMFGKRGAK